MPFWQILNLHPFSRITRNADDGGAGGAGDGFDFPDTVASLDAVPEKARGLYIKDGEGFAYKDPAALHGALTNAKAEREAARKEAAKAREWEKLGKTPAELSEMLSEREASATQKAEADGDIEKIRESLMKDKQKSEAHYNEVIQKKDADYQALQGQLHQMMVVTQATTHMTEGDLGGVPAMLMPHVERTAKVVIEDGKPEVHILDADGERRYAGGRPMTLKGLVREMYDDPVLSMGFKSSAPGGGGASNNPGSGGAKTMKRAAFQTLSPGEQTARMGQGYTLVD